MPKGKASYGKGMRSYMGKDKRSAKPKKAKRYRKTANMI